MKNLAALCLTSIALVSTAHCGITKPYKKETVSSKSETKFGRRTVSERGSETNDDDKSETKFGKRSLT